MWIKLAQNKATQVEKRPKQKEKSKFLAFDSLGDHLLNISLPMSCIFCGFNAVCISYSGENVPTFFEVKEVGSCMPFYTFLKTGVH